MPGVDGNETSDVFVRDLQANTTTRVSVDMNGGDPLGASSGPDVTPDGRYVAFTSTAGDLVPGDGNTHEDVFVRDLQTNTTTRVSVDIGGGDPDSFCEGAAISDDGRYVAFRSPATDLVSGDGNEQSDIFVRDLQARPLPGSASTPRVGLQWFEFRVGDQRRRSLRRVQLCRE